MKILYKIEDVANMVGLTKRTLRYYEELGLMTPPERSEGGFRLYTDEHVERLKKLITARDVLGFSLQELQAYITMSEEFVNQREEIFKTEDRQQRLHKINELELTVDKQLEMIDLKLEKMKTMRSEINQFKEKITEAKKKYIQE
ncbi:MerR family transcriptional regulator [Paenibacillus glycanilyticus]|uniref:MerR family transcriptional regulator n=1 Tax=Paenibacillus glycanilyticus TaxID=126569 RepID=A0ABQ6GKQ8_9BACL|nr:MerR family transcriptional regulator [Paenibacillus glycanilyticus]GLX69941.1 MerR family transcriptional regulator [Paenibacillus glycanilyticus]